MKRLSPIVALALLSLALACGSLRYLDNADSYLPVYCSLQKWTLFYWGQNRLGSLIPGLAFPVSDPAWNFYLQNLLSSLGLVTACLALPYCYDRSEIAWKWAGWTMLFLLLGTHSSVLWSLSSAHQPFGLSLTCLCAGWWSGNRQRWLLCFLSYFLAFWINVSLGPLAVLLILSAGLLQHRPKTQLALHSALIVSAFGSWLAICARMPYNIPQQTALRIPSPETLWLCLEKISGSLRWEGALLFLLLTAAAAWGRPRGLLRPALSLFVGFLFLCAIFPMMYWAEVNDFNPRYMYHGFWLLGAALTLPLAERSWAPPSLWPSALLAAGMFGFQTPQTFLRQHIELLRPGQLEELREARVRGLGGDYWSSWDLAFANWCQHRPELIPISSTRSDPLIPEYRELFQTGAPIATLPMSWLELMNQLSRTGFEPAQLRTVGRTRTFLVLARDGQLQPDAPANMPALRQPLSSREALLPYLGQGWISTAQGLLATYYSGELIFRRPAGCRALWLEIAPLDSRRTQVQLLDRGKPLPVEMPSQTTLRVSLAGSPADATHCLRISAYHRQTGEPIQIGLISLEFRS